MIESKSDKETVILKNHCDEMPSEQPKSDVEDEEEFETPREANSIDTPYNEEEESSSVLSEVFFDAIEVIGMQGQSSMDNKLSKDICTCRRRNTQCKF